MTSTAEFASKTWRFWFQASNLICFHNSNARPCFTLCGCSEGLMSGRSGWGLGPGAVQCRRKHKLIICSPT
jgi:hypothetical protein